VECGDGLVMVVRTPGSGGALDEVELEFSPPMLFWCASLQKESDVFPSLQSGGYTSPLLWVTVFC